MITQRSSHQQPGGTPCHGLRSFFIQKANEFKSSIWIEKDESRVNAKSSSRRSCRLAS